MSNKNGRGVPDRIWLYRPFRDLSSELCGPSDIWYGEADLGDNDIQDGVKYEYVLASSVAAPPMTSNEQRGLDALTRPIIGIENRTAQEVFDIMCDRIRLADIPSPLTQMLGDGEAAIIECLAAGKPFVFDPATNFLHADDGTVEYGIRYVPDDRQPAPADQMVVGQVDYPKILYVCEDCFEHNNEGCGNDRDRINVTPDGRWLCDDCRDENDIDIGLCNPPPKLFAAQPAPADHLMGSEERGIGIGMAIAAGIIMRSWGQEVYAREILGSAGLDTLEKLKASGVDQYDIDALMPVVATATEDK